MNVLHITPAFYPAHIYGGPIESVYQLCRHLGQAGCEVRILTTNANGPTAVLNVETSREVEISAGLSVRYCHRILRHTVSPALLRLLPDYIRKADVVHLTSVYSFPTIPTLLMCKLLRKPVIWSPRGSFQRWAGSRHLVTKSICEWLCRWVAPDKLVLHTTSDVEAQYTKQRMPGICVEMIPNGVMVPETVSHNSANGSLRLLYIGRIHPIKGIENLLRACRILNDTRDRAWSLAVAGSGESDYVQHICELIKKLALGGQVSLLGAVGQDDKRDLFQQSDALVLPSFSENFGLVVAEALAHGVPVIAGQGTPWKQLNSMECGLWVKNDPEHLADAIKEMRGMPIQEMGLRGRAWMRKEYSWSHTSLCMQACYEGLLN